MGSTLVLDSHSKCYDPITIDEINTIFYKQGFNEEQTSLVSPIVHTNYQHTNCQLVQNKSSKVSKQRLHCCTKYNFENDNFCISS